MDIIIIHGAPGNGKTTISKKLHEALKSPWFEFGWIPEFRMLNPHTEISFKDEEKMSFENLVLVCRNYVKHKFKNIILSDLNDKRILDIPTVFHNHSYIIFTLYSKNNDIIKERILKRDNTNTYKDFDQAIKMNNTIKQRPTLPNEYRIRTDNHPADEVTNQVLQLLNSHQFNQLFNPKDYNPNNYFSYTD